MLVKGSGSVSLTGISRIIVLPDYSLIRTLRLQRHHQNRIIKHWEVVRLAVKLAEWLTLPFCAIARRDSEKYFTNQFTEIARKRRVNFYHNCMLYCCKTSHDMNFVWLIFNLIFNVWILKLIRWTDLTCLVNIFYNRWWINIDFLFFQLQCCNVCKLAVWVWARMHIFHSSHIPSNFH